MFSETAAVVTDVSFGGVVSAGELFVSAVGTRSSAVVADSLTVSAAEVFVSIFTVVSEASAAAEVVFSVSSSSETVSEAVSELCGADSETELYFSVS